MAKAEQTLNIGFAMADPEGTAPVRVVAGHAERVAAAWMELAQQMFNLADALDRLSNPEAEPTEETP